MEIIVVVLIVALIAYWVWHSAKSKNQDIDNKVNEVVHAVESEAQVVVKTAKEEVTGAVVAIEQKVEAKVKAARKPRAKKTPAK